MKKLALWLMLAVMFFAALTAGCGGGSDSSDPEQTESLNDDTGSYAPNSGGRGTIGETIDLSELTANYTAHNGETLTGHAQSKRENINSRQSNCYPKRYHHSRRAPLPL